MKTFLILVSILHVLALPTINARADSHDFYRVKSVRIIVGNSVGGAMDDWARFIALYLGKHIPGTPTIVVQNMRGAGTIIAANHIFNIAKPDGLTLGLVNPAVYIDQLLRAAEVKFDWPKFSFIGSPERIDQVLFMRADGPYKTLEDIRKAAEPPRCAVRIPLSNPSDNPKNIARWRRQWAKAGVDVKGLNIDDDPAQGEKARKFSNLLSEGRLTAFRSTGKELKDIILQDLKTAINERHPNHVENIQETELQRELDQQEEFLYINSEGLVERHGDFEQLDQYLVAIALFHVTMQRQGMNASLVEVVADITHGLLGIAKHHSGRRLKMLQQLVFLRCGLIGIGGNLAALSLPTHRARELLTEAVQQINSSDDPLAFLLPFGLARAWAAGLSPEKPRAMPGTHDHSR